MAEEVSMNCTAYLYLLHLVNGQMYMYLITSSVKIITKLVFAMY